MGRWEELGLGLIRVFTKSYHSAGKKIGHVLKMDPTPHARTALTWTPEDKLKVKGASKSNMEKR